MIPIRLPWRPRARPSATLHEIPVCSKRANLRAIVLLTDRSVKDVRTIFRGQTAERGSRLDPIMCDSQDLALHTVRSDGVATGRADSWAGRINGA
jgi:hypothetical protein